MIESPTLSVTHRSLQGNRICKFGPSDPLSRYSGGGLGRGLFRVAKLKSPHPSPPPEYRERV